MHPTKSQQSLFGRNTWMYLGFILLTSFFTYFYNYQFPASVFWDEPYHIASAQKYLNNVYFMEQHPPLGKLLIALGEKIVHANPNNDQFIGTDYAKDFPEGFSFAGYRLFPALLAWLTAPLLFFIFLLITRNAAFASLLSFPYVFDNAMITHSRGAMVDSPLTFFGVLTMLLFLCVLENRKSKPERFYLLAAAFGAAFGLVLATKLVGLILILLGIPILVRLYPNWRRMVLFSATAIGSFLLVFAGIWQIHFSLGTRINPSLADNGYYQASETYKKIIADGRTSSLTSFPVMMADSLRYVGYYNKGVPRLDLCKPDENGSPFFYWPFGARSINYRWVQVSEGVYRYLFLQANPVAWLCGLLGILLCAGLLATSLFMPMKERIQHKFLMVTFLGMYVSYMLAVSQLHRVMYLYHYFMPLIFSFILFGIAFMNFNWFLGRALTENAKTVILTALGVLIFISYQVYRPLSYYEPISNTAIERLAFFPLWELNCVTCSRGSITVVPRSQ